MTLGNWGQSLLSGDAGVFNFGNPYLRDYSHASQIFRPDSYANTPKLKFLFHTYFDVNPDAYSELRNYGILVKDVKLPSYTFQTTQLNQYNRKRIIQTKLKYDPVDITFHDDNNNTIAKLWNAYYLYYYNDGAKPQNVLGTGRNIATIGSTASNPSVATYNDRNIYNSSITNDDDWGFNGGQTNSEGKKVPFFKRIVVFGFNQHSFIAYALVNPVITSFSHDTYSYAESGGTMQNRMSIDYETVVYGEGALDGRSPGDIVTGFGSESYYDTNLSPIAYPGSNGAILGQGGMRDAAGGYIQPLQGNTSTFSSPASQTYYNTDANPNLTPDNASQLNDGFQQASQNGPTIRNTYFNMTSSGQTPASTGVANSPTTGALQNPPFVTNEVNAGEQVVGTNSIGFPVDAPFNSGPPPPPPTFA